MLVGNSLGTSDGIKPLTTTPTQNSATLLRAGNLHFILHRLLFCSKDAVAAGGITVLTDWGKKPNDQFPLQSGTSAFGITQFLFFTIHSLYLGLAFLDPHGIIWALKILTMWYCSMGSLHFSMALGIDTGAPSHLLAGEDFTGIRLRKHRTRSYNHLQALTVQADPQ